MHYPNFCSECGERLARKGWRRFFGGRFCDDCARQLGRGLVRTLLLILLIVAGSFALGRFMRPAPPPLVIQRAGNSPLSDLPLELNRQKSRDSAAQSSAGVASTTEDEVYLCGARTQKGTPCRRRVHALGERCFQHKGRPSMVPPEKLVVKDK
jgi:hypothetical protein